MSYLQMRHYHAAITRLGILGDVTAAVEVLRSMRQVRGGSNKGRIRVKRLSCSFFVSTTTLPFPARRQGPIKADVVSYNRAMGACALRGAWGDASQLLRLGTAP